MWCARPKSGRKTTAAPATVSGECPSTCHWNTLFWEGDEGALTREPGNLP